MSAVVVVSVVAVSAVVVVMLVGDNLHITGEIITPGAASHHIIRSVSLHVYSESIMLQKSCIVLN